MPTHPDRVRRNYEDMCIICLVNKAELFLTRCKKCMRELFKLTDEQKEQLLNMAWDVRPQLKLDDLPEKPVDHAYPACHYSEHLFNDYNICVWCCKSKKDIESKPKLMLGPIEIPEGY